MGMSSTEPGRRPIPRWLPTAITLLRMALIPLFLLSAWACQTAAAAGRPEEGWRIAAVAFLCAIGASDLVDGYLARRHGLASQLGAVLDALADKLTQVSLLLFFAFSRGPAFASVPLWLPGLIVARDVLIGAGMLAVRVRLGSVRVIHRPHGKLASTLVFVFLLWITARLPAAGLAPLLWLVAGVVTVSTVQYVREGVAQLREAARIR